MPVSTAASEKTTQSVSDATITMDRRRKDRRNEPSAETTATNPPRHQNQRRRHIDPTTCERDYSDREVEFMKAMDDYKHSSGRMFPTCSEVLEVIRSLGYVQLTEEQCTQLGIEEDVASEEEACAEEEAFC